MQLLIDISDPELLGVFSASQREDELYARGESPG
jgi:hypothetical protein